MPIYLETDSCSPELATEYWTFNLTLLADQYFLDHLDMQWKLFIKINNATEVSFLLYGKKQSSVEKHHNTLARDSTKPLTKQNCVTS